MTKQLEALLHTEQQINDYFILESLILSTRTADLYKAFDKSRGAHISLWVGKGSLGINSGPVRNFVEKITKIQRIEPLVSKILSFGVDCMGIPFCVFPTLDGHTVVHGNKERNEVERRFVAALRIIEKLHNIDIACGDICSGTFWVQRSGDVILLGVMCLDEKDFVDRLAPSSPDSMYFLAPEQSIDTDYKNESSQNSANEIRLYSDVYALGILGFKLFAGKYPQEYFQQNHLQGQPILISEIISDPPVWCNLVFSTCMQTKLEERYSKASSMITAISQIKENSTLAESMPTRTVSDGKSLVANSNTGLRLSKPINSRAIQKIEQAHTKPSKSILLKGILVVFAVFVASFGIFLFLFQKKVLNKTTIDNTLEMHEKALKTEDNIEIPAAISDKQAYFQKMVLSDDPIYHDILIKAAKDSRNDEERFLAETAILDRARRLGLRRSAEIVRPWLRTLNTGQLPPAYEAVLRSLDVTLPAEAINSSLRQAYTSYSRMILRLTAALALDTLKLEQFQEVLSQLLGDASKAKDLSQRSTIALILFSTELVSVFGDDAIQKRDQISNDDIVWLLDVLAARNDINVRALASLAIERNLLSLLRQEFLNPIRDREDLPLDILNSLVKAASGTINSEDIGRFGNWFDRAGEDILLAICADAPDDDAKLAAFDILAAKSFSKEPASSLIKWVKAKVWDKRLNFIKPIGVLSNIKYFDEEEISSAFKSFEPYMKDPAITAAFLDSENVKIVKAVVSRYTKNIGLGRRLVLLTNPDKEVRIMAVKSLEGINDLAGLKMIIDYYQKEKDEEVKKIYNDTFWVIREKEEASRH